MDQIASSSIQFATLGAAVWGFTEALVNAHPSLKSKGLFLALFLGPLFSVFGFLFHYISVPPDLSRPLQFGAAAFLGLIGTILAKGLNDYIYNPLKALLQPKP